MQRREEHLAQPARHSTPMRRMPPPPWTGRMPHPHDGPVLNHPGLPAAEREELVRRAKEAREYLARFEAQLEEFRQLQLQANGQELDILKRAQHSGENLNAKQLRAQSNQLGLSKTQIATLRLMWAINAHSAARKEWEAHGDEKAWNACRKADDAAQSAMTQCYDALREETGLSAQPEPQDSSSIRTPSHAAHGATPAQFPSPFGGGWREAPGEGLHAHRRFTAEGAESAEMRHKPRKPAALDPASHTPWGWNRNIFTQRRSSGYFARDWSDRPWEAYGYRGSDMRAASKTGMSVHPLVARMSTLEGILASGNPFGRTPSLPTMSNMPGRPNMPGLSTTKTPRRQACSATPVVGGAGKHAGDPDRHFTAKKPTEAAEPYRRDACATTGPRAGGTPAPQAGAHVANGPPRPHPPPWR